MKLPRRVVMKPLGGGGLGFTGYSAVITSSYPDLLLCRGGLWRGCRGAGEAGLKVPWFDGDVSLSIFKLEWV